MIGSSGTCGVLKGRSIFGSVRRSTATAIATTTNANSVPMLTISARASIGTNEAITATTIVVPMVIRNGVLNFGCTLPIPAGSRPSRHSAKPIRPMQTMSTRITEVSPATAATDTRVPAQSSPTCLKASEIGALLSMVL